MKALQRGSLRKRQCQVDDSPETVEARMRAFADRTRGWGVTEAATKLPDGLAVLAGPTRRNPRFRYGHLKKSRLRRVLREIDALTSRS